MSWSRNAAISILASLLASDAMATNTWMVWKEYQTWAKAVYPENDVALAVSPNGKSAWGAGSTVSQAKQSALGNCKAKHLKVQWENCRVVDVNFSSKGNLFAQNSNSGTNASKVWCATNSSVFEATKKYCNTRSGAKAFSTKALAQAEHLRLKKQADQGSTDSNSTHSGWCARASAFFKATKTSCNARGGQWKRSYNAAKAEHKTI